MIKIVLLVDKQRNLYFLSWLVKYVKMKFQYKVSSYLFKITFEKEISLFFTQIPFSIVYTFYPVKFFHWVFMSV